ncbi:MAG: hypothetical protein HKN90_08655 [Flavobacteriaceae bacterium]|nr:hypothetical protein [Flavobacteriaceae bacterium]
MKGLIKKVLVMVALIAAVTVSYANEISHNESKNEKNTTNLTLANVKSGAILKIIDKNGFILYKEVIEKEGTYSKEFDLTELPNGNYFFELNKEVEIIEIPFSVSNGVVKFDKHSKKTIFKPVVYYNDGKVFISKMSFDAETMDVSIYYEDDTKVLKDAKIAKKGNVLGKIYDFTGSEKGTYTLIITNNGREFVNQVKI